MIDRYRCVVWDWNGTLLDDLWLALEVANGMLSRRKIATMDADRYRDIFDFPVEQYYRRAGFDLEAEPFSVLADEFIGEFNRRLGECSLRSLAREVLETLAGRGTFQLILSASRLSSLIDAVELHGINGYFHKVSGLDNHFAVSKIEAGRALIASLPFPKSEIVMIGDTTHDAEVARALGLTPILVAGGHQSSARLHTVGVPVIRSFGELVTLDR